MILLVVVLLMFPHKIPFCFVRIFIVALVGGCGISSVRWLFCVGYVWDVAAVVYPGLQSLAGDPYRLGLVWRLPRSIWYSSCVYLFFDCVHCFC